MRTLNSRKGVVSSNNPMTNTQKVDVNQDIPAPVLLKSEGGKDTPLSNNSNISASQALTQAENAPKLRLSDMISMIRERKTHHKSTASKTSQNNRLFDLTAPKDEVSQSTSLDVNKPATPPAVPR